MYQKNQSLQSDQEHDTDSSDSDSSEWEDDQELLEKMTQRKDQKDHDDARSSTIALHEFTLERNTVVGNEPLKATNKITDTRSKSVEKFSQGPPDTGDENERTDENDSSREGSQLHTVDNHFSKDQTVYSNLYIRAQHANNKGFPIQSDSGKTVKDDAMFSHVMRVSKDGFG